MHACTNTRTHMNQQYGNIYLTSSSVMAETPRELDQRFQMGGQFEAIID